MNLYPDQQDCIAKLRDAFRQFRAPLFVAPTGFGKTIVFAYITRQMHQKQRRVVIGVHRIELVNQVSRALTAWGVPHGILSPGHPYTDHPVQVASVFTLARRVSYFPEPYLFIIDEAHHARRDSTWGKIMVLWRNAYKLGVTATPIRLDGAGLGDMFDTMVLGPSPQTLIDAGRLSPLRIFAPPTIDTTGLHLQAGDFKKGELSERADKPSIIGDVIGHYRRHAEGRRTIAFCVSVEHAHHIAQGFRDAGIRAIAVDGGMQGDVRDDAIRSFADGHVTVLASCDLVSEGFDVPGIECGLLLRPTASTGLYLQQVGRCLRAVGGKHDAIILDHVGNTARHGWPAAERNWQLTTTGPGKKGKSDAPTLRVCEKCFAATRTPALACCHCGEPFKAQPRVVESKDGTLEEITAEHARVAARQAQGMTQTLKGLVDLGIQRGYHPVKARVWAEKVLAGRAAKQRRSHTLRG